MTKFKNYNTAKFVTIFLSQLRKPDEKDGVDYKKEMFNTSANGYIICPYEEGIKKQNKWNINYLTVKSTPDLTDKEKKDGIKSISDLSDKVSSLIEKIVKFNQNAKIWIGTPGIDSNCFQKIDLTSTRQLFEKYLEQVKTAVAKIGKNTWDNNIYGVYYNQESIYTREGDPIAFKTEAEYTKNTQVQLMNDFAYEVRNSDRFGKLDLIWIPYYAMEREGYTKDENNAFMAENIKRIAYIVHRTTIFDAVFLQASYISNKEVGEVNFSSIIKSIDDGLIHYRSRGAVFSDSIRECKIGAEVEWKTGSGSNALEAYTGKYAKYVNNKPLAFYWEGDADAAISEINKFYTVDLSGELDGNVNIPCETGYTIDKTYESNYVLKKGDVVKFNYDFSITPPYVEPERTEWEALQDFVFNINDKNYGITAGARYENQNYYFSFNYNESDSNEYSDSVVFEAGEELDGKKLSLYINLPRMSVYGGSFGVDLSYEIYVNDIRIV